MSLFMHLQTLTHAPNKSARAQGDHTVKLVFFVFMEAFHKSAEFTKGKKNTMQSNETLK